MLIMMILGMRIVCVKPHLSDKLKDWDQLVSVETRGGVNNLRVGEVYYGNIHAHMQCLTGRIRLEVRSVRRSPPATPSQRLEDVYH